MLAARLLPASALALLLAAAGCFGGGQDAPPGSPVAPGHVVDLQPIALANGMTFRQSVVSPAQGVAADLYEPTMEVSDTGTLYVAAHVIGAATTGTPAYFSRDDGASWDQLPFLGPLAFPSPIQGAQPPPGDEGFIVAGDDGQVWMADIYLLGFSVSGWCGDGAELCYDNRQAYDRIAATSGMCSDGIDIMASTASSLNDRPWAAYSPGVGRLLLVNNPGGGPMQIGVMDVPPAAPVGSSDPVTGPTWNLCASPDGWIPGIPAMRADGFFAVPQLTGNGDDEHLTVVTGNVEDIFNVQVVDVFHVTSGYGGTSNGGRTAFDLDGTLFVGAYNNTEADDVKDVKGRFILAVSTDDATHFANVTFATTSPVRSLYLDSNPYGPGVLVTWSQLGETTEKNEQGETVFTRSDWYVAHLVLGPDGKPELRNVSLAVDEGPHSSAHVMGASLGPDGRAYFVNFQDVEDPLAYLGTTPLSVWIQEDGPTLPSKPA